MARQSTSKPSARGPAIRTAEHAQPQDKTAPQRAEKGQQNPPAIAIPSDATQMAIASGNTNSDGASETEMPPDCTPCAPRPIGVPPTPLAQFQRFLAPQPTSKAQPSPTGGLVGQDTADRALHAAQARLTGGISPISIASAAFNWSLQLANAPGHQMGLAHQALENGLRLSNYSYRRLMQMPAAAPFAPRSGDRRFNDPAWQALPFDIIAQSHFALEDWWRSATTNIRGLRPHHSDQVSFLAQQMLDFVAPCNFPWSNPRILRAAMSSGGRSLALGARNLVEDISRRINREPSPALAAFKVGKQVATSKGDVVFRNDLIELIQYAPTTKKVHPEPILIIPAWIMKFYILDLSPENSLVNFLVSRGHTVFMVSWKNPSTDDRNLSLDDYRRLGVMAALDTVSRIVPEQRIHATGYCLGGTILAIAAAAMARNGDRRLASLNLLAAQTDFADAGAMMRFIDDSQLAFLEDLMWDQGYLDTRQMAGALDTLDTSNGRAARMAERYWMGTQEHWTDLRAWVEDRTRMPYRMHAEYLSSLFLENRLSAGRFAVEGRPVALGDIDAPIFAVGTEKDQLAPWYSVYKINLLAHTDITFLLTNRGHNTGIVAAEDAGRHYRINTKSPDDSYIDAQSWLSANAPQAGSWWKPWQEWLADHSGDMVLPPKQGATEKGLPPLDPAPGHYVLMP